MKLSLNWLQDFLKIEQQDAQQLADTMSRTGIEIEGIDNYGAALSNLVVGHVVSVVDHEDSDRLHVCQVEVGNGVTKQIVCGAANVHEGAKVIVALPGATLPQGVTIQEGELRGVVSQGMLCALQELGFSDSVIPKQYADGLFLLPQDAPVGQSVMDYLALNDAILELSLTPNRADALSMRGLAHEVGAITSQEPHFALEKLSFVSDERLEKVEVEVDSTLSERYELRLIRNVTIQESPLWLQMRLMKAGIRPINNIVDATNYGLLLYGQPMHAFDYDTLGGKISVRLARVGEVLTTLDGAQRVLTAEDMVICNNDTPIALAGVMGGLDSEVTDKTTTILLETAVFNPLRVRETAKRFNLRSESSARFEKGINHATVTQAGEQVAQLMAILGNGEVVAGVVAHDVLNIPEVSITVAYESVSNKLGVTLSVDELREIFVRLGFEATFDTATFTVNVPPRRWDIRIEADVMEEIARIYGYDKLPMTLPSVPSTPGQLNATQRLVRQSRAICEGFGLNQTISYVLTSPKAANLLKSDAYPFVVLDFPMSEDRSVLRQSMFPVLLEITRYNHARNNSPLAFYEIGKVFFSRGVNQQPIEEERLAMLLSGQKQSATWNGKAQSYDFYDMKGIVEAYFEAVRLDRAVTFVPITTVANFHPGRTAHIVLDGEVIGLLGQIHPLLAKEYDLPQATYFAEMNLEKVLNAQRDALVQRPIPKFPSTSRDVALLVDDKTAHQVLEDTIRQNGGDYLVNVELFDLYVSQEAFSGKKSLAYRLTFQNIERTLTEEDVTHAMAQVTTALQAIDGLEIR